MHRGTVLTVVEAVHILFPEAANPADPRASFRPDAEVRARLASHFGYNPDLHAGTSSPPPGDVELLLYALEVSSLEELRDLVQAGRRVQERTPLIVV